MSYKSPQASLIRVHITRFETLHVVEYQYISLAPTNLLLYRAYRVYIARNPFNVYFFRACHIIWITQNGWLSKKVILTAIPDLYSIISCIPGYSSGISTDLRPASIDTPLAIFVGSDSSHHLALNLIQKEGK